jgi:AcrR family transcriptional regulator
VSFSLDDTGTACSGVGVLPLDSDAAEGPRAGLCTRLDAKRWKSIGWELIMRGGEAEKEISGEVVRAMSERGRVVAAFTRTAAEQGYRRIEVDQVAHYAGLSPERLELHFSSKERGLVAAQEDFLEVLWLEGTAACEVAEGWPRGVQAALRAVIAAVVDASTVARVFVVEAAASSLAAAECQFAAIDRFATLLRQGRRLYPQAASLPEVAERMLIGGIASVLCNHLLDEDPRALLQLESQMVEMLLIPYLGASEARLISRS